MPSPTSQRTRAELPPGLKISMHDRIAGTITALLVIVGFAVTVLILLWLAGRAMAGRQTPPLEIVEENPADGFQSMGSDREMVEPGVEEFADLPTPRLADTLAAVTTSVTTQQAALDELLSDAGALGSGQGRGHRDPAGPGNFVPREERFRVELSAGSLPKYARLLDFFRIEIGVMGGGVNGVTYVSNFTLDKPRKRFEFGDEADRLMFYQFSEVSELLELDRQLLANANVDSHGRAIAHFYPRDVENTLAQLEQSYLNGRPLEEVQRTFFGIRTVGQAYEFFVTGQGYRPQP